MSEFKGTQHYRKVANQVKFTWPITLRSTGLDELSGRYAEDVNDLCNHIEHLERSFKYIDTTNEKSGQ